MDYNKKPDVKNYIRPVRDFGDEAEAFWMDPYLADGTKSGSLEVNPQTTTTYDAVVVFGQDTLPLTGTVVVHEKYDTDTLYEVVCQSTEPYNSKKSSLFTNLDISQVTHGYDTLSRTTHTIHGCDSTVALLLKVVGDCEHFYRDSICPIVTQHDFLPFDTTFLPGTISGVYEHHGKKTVEGTEIDTVAFYDLTIMPEYHLTDDLHLCLEEETTVIPYTENEHVTITVTHGKITLASDDARVVIDSTDKVNGNFVLRMTTEFGCDSLVTLHIDTSSVQFDTVRRTDVFVANTPECTDRVIGAQNSTSSYYPLSNYNNYSCSQQIFTSAELGEAGPINTISFNYASATPTTSKTDVKIYLAHTTKNSFSGSYDWVSPSSMTLVYDGELNCANQGWNEFVLNQTFDYNGTDNLLVMVLDESDAGDGSYSFYSTSTPGGSYKTLYYYSTGSYWVPGSYGYRGSYRSDIRFSGCTEDNVFYTTEVAGNSFTVSEPGTYTKTETVTGSNGCDSTTTTILVVRPPYEDEICDSTFHAETQTWTDNVEPYCWQHLGASYCIAGKTLDEHGLYKFFGKDTIGGVEMDTTLYLKLTINPTYRDTNDVQLCVDGRDTTFTHPDNNDVRIAISSTGEVTSVTSVNTEKVTVEPLLVDGVPSATDFVLRMKTVKGCDSVEVLHIETTFVQRDTVYMETLLESDVFTCVDKTISNQNGSGHNVPLNDYFVYSCSQQIFTPDEIGNAGSISKLSFNYVHSSATTKLSDVYIYLGHTGKSSFSSNTDWVQTSAMELVYHGPLNCHQGWNEFTLDTPFDYNGTDNLIIMVNDVSGNSYDGSSYNFYYTNSTKNNVALAWSSDSYTWITSRSGSLYNYRSDIRFYGCSYPTVEFADKTFTVTNPGTYVITDTVTGSNGCDSITVRYLIVEEPHEDEICDSTYTENHTWVDNVGPYCWEYNGKNNCIADKDVNADGYYEFPDTKTIDGHEFEITSYLKLTINPTSRDTDSIGTCLYEEPTGITYSVNGGTLSLSLTEAKITVTNTVTGVTVDTIDAAKGDFALKMQTVKGCDSVIVLHIDRKVVARDTVYKDTLYAGTSYTTEFADKTFTVDHAGTYTITDTIQGGAANGCDSITVRYLIVEEPHEDEICDSTFNASHVWVDNVGPYCWPYNGENNCIAGKTVNSLGYYEFPGTKTIDGHEFEITSYLKLTINPTSRDTDTVTTCLYEEPTEITYSVNGGTLSLSLTEAKVTVTNSVTGVTVDTIDAAKGDFALKMQTVKGCDSVIVLHIDRKVVARDTVYKDTLYAGTSYTTEFADKTFTVDHAGTYTITDTIPEGAANGCDSITVRYLIVEEPHEDEICDSTFNVSTQTWTDNVGPYEWNGIPIAGLTVNEDGYYEFPGKKTINGTKVDTTTYLKLTIDPTHRDTNALDICLLGSDSTFTYEGNTNVTISVTTTTTLVTSTDATKVTVYPVKVGGEESKTDFILLMKTVDGCDSVEVLHVGHQVVQRDTLTDQVHIAQVAANGNKWTVGGYTFENITEPGVYTRRDTLPGSNGCDSIVLLEVDVLPCPELSIVCPPDHYDTLAFGDCVMEIYPEKIGTPTVTVDPADWPFEVSNDIPADNLYQEGETIITWVATDPVCGYSASCEQKVIVVFPKCPDAIDCEGNVYHGVRIDCDCWTQTNLISNCYGDAHECEISGNCDDPIPCVYEYVNPNYPNADENVAIFGKLYCAEAGVGDSTVNEHGHIRGICPEGWYLPTPEKYEELNLHGAEALKSPLYWTDGGGDNSTGFTWLPAGWWNGALQRFEGLMSEGYFLSTEVVHGEVKTYVYEVHHDCDSLIKKETHTGLGYSVRCVKEKD